MPKRLGNSQGRVAAVPRLLAHSAPAQGGKPQWYGDHVRGVVQAASCNARALAAFASDPAMGNAFVKAVEDGAEFHDLGKLDEDNQAVLRGGRQGSMTWDHIDAGVAHLTQHDANTAAWAVRAHHAPGLPRKATHFSALGRNADQVRKLRGRRNDTESMERHAAQIARTDSQLSTMLARHMAEFSGSTPTKAKTQHGLPLRFALSCIVDADHADSASFDSGWSRPSLPATRWEDRLAALDAYVAGLAGAGDRSGDRAEFYAACRKRVPDAEMIACDGPVGIGKTTAVLAYLLRRAIATKARRLFVVAPYTAILSQTASTVRRALVLPDERHSEDAIVAEHHHRADFANIASRDLATLWSAPIVLTTSVQFFETLAANAPSALRKLHALPGSVVFLDEAHAALPTPLWPQNWRWLRSLAKDWSCSFVFASGSLARFWENEDIALDGAVLLPDIVAPSLAQHLIAREASRVVYNSLGRLDGPDGISNAIDGSHGPRLLILNTVQSACVMAQRLRKIGRDVMHISTALCPDHRSAVLKRVIERLNDPGDDNWTLVATSLVEAGIDISFKTAFRERFSVSSLIQIGGRVNRHGADAEPGIVHDFFFDKGRLLKQHPAAVNPGQVVNKLFERRKFSGPFDPAALVTNAMAQELRIAGAAKLGHDLCNAEKENDYPAVARLGRVIDADTKLVVVDPDLRDILIRRVPVSYRTLLAGSVQIWSYALQSFGLSEITQRPGVFWWPHSYDKEFLGYMEGALKLQTGEAFIV